MLVAAAGAEFGAAVRIPVMVVLVIFVAAPALGENTTPREADTRGMQYGLETACIAYGECAIGRGQRQKESRNERHKHTHSRRPAGEEASTGTSTSKYTCSILYYSLHTRNAILVAYSVAPQRKNIREGRLRNIFRDGPKTDYVVSRF